MQVCLVSSDRKLRDFVSEVVGSGFLSCEQWTEAELCVFDFEPG